MNVEDPNVWTSRVSHKTWRGFVESRRPTQVVCNSQKAVEGRICQNTDVRSCQLNGICERMWKTFRFSAPWTNSSKEGVLYDCEWVDIGHVRAPLKNYICDGAHWYAKATTKFLLETGVCRWPHIELGFEATAHKSPQELTGTLQKMRSLWLEVGRGFQAQVFLGARADKKNRSELVCETTLLSLLGALGRTENYRHHMITTSCPDDLLWNGETSSKPRAESELTSSGYVFTTFRGSNVF